MCEFCTQHGEGKQWYRLMQNYSTELLNARLSVEQKTVTGFDTRMQWVDDFIRTFVFPAATGKSPILLQAGDTGYGERKAPTSEEQRLAWRKIKHFGQVLPIEEVDKVFGMADSITRIPCGCRFDSAGLTNARYCFGLGVDTAHVLGKYLNPSTSFELMDKNEAMQLIRKFDDEGLMHSVWTGVTPYVIGVCNCDGDCGAYRAYIRNHGSPRFFRAEYLCQVDIDQCNGCKECMRQCQFGAISYSSALGKVTIEPELCFGCGVCRAACQQNAIALLSRAEVPAAAEVW